MSGKDKAKKSKAESANKKRIVLKLQKNEAFSAETAKSLKELGITNKKRFEKHLELLIAEGTVKEEGRGDPYRYWVKREKVEPKKKSSSMTFFVLWMGSTFVLLLIFVYFFS